MPIVFALIRNLMFAPVDGKRFQVPGTGTWEVGSGNARSVAERSMVRENHLPAWAERCAKNAEEYFSTKRIETYQANNGPTDVVFFCAAKI